MVAVPDPPAHGGAAAPGPLHLVQSFASTLGTDQDTDLLHTREEAAAWLHAAALLPAEAGLTNSEHAALLRLRGSIRDVLAAHTEGREDAEAAARLTRALADGRLVLTVDPASTVRLASAARASYPNLVAAVAIAIAESAAAGTWLRLKSCSVPQCGQAFYDDTGSSAGTQCSRHATGTAQTSRTRSPGQ
jgi:predicted RNA-binding Zn ribbon-like protein